MMVKTSVLVVEDHPLLRATAVRIFEDLGFTVFDAYNGAHALSIIAANIEIGLMFIDVKMPGMSGPELAEVVRRRRPDMRIVLTSGYVAAEQIPSGLPFVPKPWRVDEVAKAVQH